MNIKIKDSVGDIVRLTNEGYNNNEIAEILGSNPPAIRYWQKKLNIKSNPVVPELGEVTKLRIVELYSEYKDALKVSQLLGTTQFRVLKHLKSLGIDTSSRFFKDSVAQEVFDKYASGLTQKQIADIYGCEVQAVRALFKANNFKARNQTEQSKITWPKNRDVFTDFTDEDTLFFYGLLLADGCISDNGSVSLALQISDLHIVESFQKYIGSDNKIIIVPPKDNRQAQAAFRFQDREISERLIKMGMLPRKSIEEKMPSFDLSDDNLARHFWRGYVCGDGSIRSYPSNGNSDRLIPRMHICGSREICEGFSDFCTRVLSEPHGLKVYRSEDKRRTNQIYNFRISGKKARDIALFMFDNSKTYINRKMEDIEKFRQYVPKW